MVLVHVAQTCTIGGRSYRIASSSIDSSLNATLRMRFVVERDANPLAAVPDIGERVVVTQAGNGTQTFHGVVSAVTPERGVEYTRYAVDALGLSELAAHRRILNAWPPIDAQTLVESAWNFYGPAGVTYVPDEVSEPQQIEEYSSAYDSLMDLVAFAANSTGWAWLCEGETFRFFNPVSFPVGGTIGQSDFAAGTLRAARDGANLFNVARQQAWEYTSANFNDPIIPEDVRRRAYDTVQVIYCATRFRGPGNLAGVPFDQWQFVSGRVIGGRTPAGGTFSGGVYTPPIGSTDDLQIEVSFSDEEMVVETDYPLLAPPNSGVALLYPVRIEATFRRLVWTEARHAGSIATYGEREAPVLPNDGGVDVPESLRRLAEYLEQRAYPPIELTGQYLRTDIHPGERRTVVIPELGVNGQYIVENVRRTYSRDGLAVDVTMRSVQPGEVRAARPKPDIGPEIFKRLERLESQGLSPASAAGASWIEGGPITGIATFAGRAAWAGEFEVEPLTEAITIEEDF